MGLIWNRIVTVQVANLKISLEDHDVEATVENDVTSPSGKSNTGEIVLWNINDQFFAALKNGAIIELCAGYADDSGTIFYGLIEDIDRTRDGADQKTVITVLDSSVKTKTTDKVAMTYPKGTTVADGVRRVLAAAGVAEGTISVPNVVFDQDTTYTQTLDDQIKHLLDYENGVLMRDNPSTYKTVTDCTRFMVVNNLAYFVPKNHCTATVILLSYSTGLLNVSKIKKNIAIATGDTSSEETYGDYKITSYLNHAIAIATVVKVDCEEVTGSFRVVSYKHTISKNDFITEMTVVAVV